jgi:light-regulated signal transduction histidine kinase (bacteriophytochrome)
MNDGVIVMFQKFKLLIFILFWVVIILVLFDMGISDKTANVEAESEVIPEHQELNQKPEPLDMKRSGTDVYIKMNAQITDIKIKDGVTYKAWTFNGEAPGPVVVVNEGDTLHFTLENMDPAMDHSNEESNLIFSIKNDIKTENKVAVEKVFERFYTADNSRTNTEASGLGLYLSKKLVEKMNGKMDAELNDHWFTLRIFLPINRNQRLPRN